MLKRRAFLAILHLPEHRLDGGAAGDDSVRARAWSAACGPYLLMQQSVDSVAALATAEQGGAACPPAAARHSAPPAASHTNAPPGRD
jgi:hypothetical protein